MASAESLNLHPLYKDQNATRFFAIDFKGKAECPYRLWVATREQVFDHENGIRDQWPVKTKELVSAEGIEPSTY